VEQLVSEGMVHDVADLYSLTVGDLMPLEGFAEKKARSLVEAIQRSREQPLHRVLTGLGIRGVGTTVAQLLVEHYPTLHGLAKAPQEALEAVPGVGPHTARNVRQWFEADRNRDLIGKLERAGVHLAEQVLPREDEGVSHPLAGQTFVITGTLPSLSRGEATELIQSCGGKVTGSVSSKTTYLLCGESPGSKLAKAQQLGVPVIDENALRAMIGER
jgi:DNA ligase (NAD+)